MQPPPGYLTTLQAARQCSIPFSTLRSWIYQGRLPGIRRTKTRRYLIPMSHIEAIKIGLLPLHPSLVKAA